MLTKLWGNSTHTHTHTHKALKVFVVTFITSISTLFLSAQEIPKQGVVATGAYIEVSDSLYKSIKDWLLFGNQEKRLDEFLLWQHYNEREVLDFLGAYYSGATATNNYKTGSSEPCVCNVIRASTVDLHKSSTPYESNSVDDNNHTEEYEIANDGMYKVLYHKIYGSQGGNAVREVNGFVKIELLNLCTYLGALQTECNCNKPIQVEGAYYRFFDYDSGSGWCIPCANARSGKLVDGFMALSMDLEPSANNIWMAPEITVSNSKQKERYFEVNSQLINWAAFLTAAEETAKLILGNFNFNSTVVVKDETVSGITNTQTTNPLGTQGISNLANALVNIPGQHSEIATAHNVSETQVFQSMLTLKANTPKVLFFATAAKSELSAYGQVFKDLRITTSSSFYVAISIPEHPISYDQNGNEIGQDWSCCNELYGTWYHTPVWQPSGGGLYITEQDLKDRIKSRLNYGGFNRWSYASEHPIGSQIITAHVDAQSAHTILDIYEAYGEVGSTQICGCENLYDGQNNSLLLSPQLVPSGNCLFANGTSTVLIQDNTYPHTQVNQNLIETEWLYNGLPIAGSQNQPSWNAVLPGIYALRYKDITSLVCQSIGFVRLPECPGKTEAMATDFLFYPNPANIFAYVGFADSELYSLHVFDTNGQLVMQQESLQGIQEVNLGFLKVGVYYVIIDHKNLQHHAKLVIVR